MSVIAMKGVPLRWSLVNVSKIVAKVINGKFEALNFQNTKGTQTSKICYLRLSEKLDPVRVIEKINSTAFPKQFRPFAYIPDEVPDIPLAAKLKNMPKKMRKELNLTKLPDENVPFKVKLTLTTNEILSELQYKYPRLHDISIKSSHKLLSVIGKKIFQRLKVIADNNVEVTESCFKLSQWYRRMHPHFGDFQLVLSTMHALEDAAGTPRTQLQESEIDALPPQPQMLGNIPVGKVQAACEKYSERIIKKITEHVKNLKSDMTESDTEDEIVRKKVREELKKMSPFLPLIVKQVVMKHFVPRTAQGVQKVRIYGEPFLPNQDTMNPFVRRYQPMRLMREKRMFNCLTFNVAPQHFAPLMAMDGTVLNGAKLVIRSADLPILKVSEAVLTNDPNAVEEEDPEDAMDEDGGDDWNEMM